MHRHLRHSALLLLAVFAAGGVLAPAVHEVWHAEETARLRASHLTDPTHHHHLSAEEHGTEAVEPCPDPLAADWSCVLCHGVSVHVPAMQGTVVPPASGRRLAGTGEALVPAARVAHHSIRGPPKAVA